MKTHVSFLQVLPNNINARFRSSIALAYGCEVGGVFPPKFSIFHDCISKFCIMHSLSVTCNWLLLI